VEGVQKAAEQLAGKVEVEVEVVKVRIRPPPFSQQKA
jgi:hypothetical protein